MNFAWSCDMYKSRLCVLSACVLGLLGCFGSLQGPTAIMTQLNPNLIPHWNPEAALTLGSIDVGPGEICAQGLEMTWVRFCVQGARGSLQNGLQAMLAAYNQPVSGVEPLVYRAGFRLIDLSVGLSPGDSRSAQLTLRYQFWLLAPDGRPICELAESVIGPEAYVYGLNENFVVRALFNTALEHIAAALNRTSFTMTPEEKERQRAADESRRAAERRQREEDQQRAAEQQQQAAEQRAAEQRQKEAVAERQKQTISSCQAYIDKFHVKMTVGECARQSE